jgi:diazepam-binding inhibitor (GABA receptor modulating acyl-CoA-binding protein)
MSKIYGLYKQATLGDANPNDQPYFYQVEARAKFDAWLTYKGTSKEDAMKAYIEEAEQQLTDN